MLEVVDQIPDVHGKLGRPQRRPEELYGDGAYDRQPHRYSLRDRGVRPRLARRNAEHGSELGCSVGWRSSSSASCTDSACGACVPIGPGGARRASEAGLRANMPQFLVRTIRRRAAWFAACIGLVCVHKGMRTKR
jgi:hypothetical protein